jgi:hypothetical protein
MLSLPLAHAGHWALWVLYAVPVVVVLSSVVVTTRRERRVAAEREAAGETTPGEDAA